jgi:hypothetical protein
MLNDEHCYVNFTTVCISNKYEQCVFVYPSLLNVITACYSMLSACGFDEVTLVVCA